MLVYPVLYARRVLSLLCAVAAACLVAILLHSPAHAQDPVFVSGDIAGPAGSGAFGTLVYALPNGNVVVTDPGYDNGATLDVGAVYLYDGATAALVSRVTGGSGGDQVGSSGIQILGTGNFVIRSPQWDNPTPLKSNVGAATFVNATTGLTGTVSAANSLIGGSANDTVGGIDVLANGSYVVRAINWDNPDTGATNAGVVAWGSGVTGVSGVASSANALVGTTTNDYVGSELLTLPNGAYVVMSDNWDNGLVVDAGAATWGSGTTPLTGAVSALNSLVGTFAADRVGEDYLLLPNGNYVVRTTSWGSAPADVGAVTFGNAATGVSGAVSEDNSLVGTTAGDRVGTLVEALTNSNYVVGSQSWDAPGAVNAGAVTWCSGVTGCQGPVSTGNSLYGGAPNDGIGNRLTSLTNGHYVVMASDFDNAGVADVGAVTWANGTIQSSGVVTAANSLIGSSANDEVGSDGAIALANGNYVVNSVYWNSGTASEVGAVTWRNGSGPAPGVVSAANSLVGSQANDRVGEAGIQELSNGNYVVHSSVWDNGADIDGGAFTWGSGTGGVSGPVSAANSLIAATAGDLVWAEVRPLNNGGFIVEARKWDNPAPAVADAGAFRFSPGTGPITGPFTAANAVLGLTTDDMLAIDLVELANGNVAVGVPYWDNGTAVDAGALRFFKPANGIAGSLSAANALVGGKTNDNVGNVTVALPNGNYVALNDRADVGPRTDNGAVTWGDGVNGTTGVIGVANSLVGVSDGDRIGSNLIFLTNGNIAFLSPQRDVPSGGPADAGAATLLDGRTPSIRILNASNSVLGQVAGGGQFSATFNDFYQYLVVGRKTENKVTLAALRWGLTVGRNGSGAGAVTSSLPGITCGADCFERFNGNRVVTLTVSVPVSSTLSGWSGDCTGTGPCVVTIDRTRTVTATFTLKNFPLLTSVVGGGTIGGLPPNPAALTYGTVVTLTASAQPNNQFTGWSGDCTGFGACVVTMTQARSVTATFGPIDFNVTLPPPSPAGSVQVEVISTTVAAEVFTVTVARSDGAASVEEVTATYPAGSVLRLTAVPNSGYAFVAWGGALSGAANPQQITLNGPLAISATFKVADVLLPIVVR